MSKFNDKNLINLFLDDAKNIENIENYSSSFLSEYWKKVNDQNNIGRKVEEIGRITSKLLKSTENAL